MIERSGGSKSVVRHATDRREGVRSIKRAVMQGPAIKATGLGRRFGQRWALAHLDLEIPRGECFLIVGANGGGKTTLLRLLSTTIVPSVGGLELLGYDASPPASAAAGRSRRSAEAVQQIRRRVALLSHQLGLYEDLSATENLLILSRLLGVEPRTEQWLEEVGLPVRPDPVRNYSAGMRKRLGFARLIAQSPQLALIDEPYGQLDPEGFKLTEGLLGRLRDRGVTLVIASHLVERAARYCDRALLLDAGLPRWQGPAEDVVRAWSAVHGRAA